MIVYLQIFNEETKLISHKYEKTDYPKRVIDSVIRQFQNKSNQRHLDDIDYYITPSNFLVIPKSFILIELSFYKNNETKSKHNKPTEKTFKKQFLLCT